MTKHGCIDNKTYRGKGLMDVPLVDFIIKI